jgi:hypothetical protein
MKYLLIGLGLMLGWVASSIAQQAAPTPCEQNLANYAIMLAQQGTGTIILQKENESLKKELAAFKKEEKK